MTNQKIPDFISECIHQRQGFRAIQKRFILFDNLLTLPQIGLTMFLGIAGLTIGDTTVMSAIIGFMLCVGIGIQKSFGFIQKSRDCDLMSKNYSSVVKEYAMLVREESRNPDGENFKNKLDNLIQRYNFVESALSQIPPDVLDHVESYVERLQNDEAEEMDDDDNRYLMSSSTRIVRKNTTKKRGRSELIDDEDEYRERRVSVPNRRAQDARSGTPRQGRGRIGTNTGKQSISAKPAPDRDIEEGSDNLSVLSD